MYVRKGGSKGTDEGRVDNEKQGGTREIIACVVQLHTRRQTHTHNRSFVQKIVTLNHYERYNQNTDEDSFPLYVPGERVSTETAINTAIRTDSLNTLDVWAYPCISLPSCGVHRIKQWFICLCT